MSYKYSFADNETYNAADVNKITSRLVSSGVSDPFENGKPYGSGWEFSKMPDSVSQREAGQRLSGEKS